MNPSSGQRALAASTAALVVCVACIVTFLPPLAERTLASLPLTALIGLVIAVALPLHWVFLGVAARRLGRSVPGWVALAVVLFPVGGAAALILLSWFEDEQAAPSSARAG
jgi:hypothetical protein